MKLSWKNELSELFTRLEVLKDKFADRDHYYHTIVFVEGEPSLNVLMSIPNNYASTKRDVDREKVKLTLGGYHLHSTFDQNPDDSDHQLLTILKKELATASRYLSKLPSRRFPKIEVPELRNGAKESWLHWLYLLTWLPKLQREFRFEHPELLPSGLYQVIFEYLDTYEQLVNREKFKEWDSSPYSNVLDPRWVTIPQTDEGGNQEKWFTVANGKNIAAPQVVSASISKQLLLCSWESARFILQVADIKAAPRNKNRESSKLESTLDDNAVILLHLMIALHLCDRNKGYQRTIHFTINKLARLMTDSSAKSEKPETWDFSRTQRALNAIMSRLYSDRLGLKKGD